MAEGRREWTIADNAGLTRVVQGPELELWERVRVVEVGVSPEEERRLPAGTSSTWKQWTLSVEEIEALLGLDWCAACMGEGVVEQTTCCECGGTGTPVVLVSARAKLRAYLDKGGKDDNRD